MWRIEFASPNINVYTSLHVSCPKYLPGQAFLCGFHTISKTDYFAEYTQRMSFLNVHFWFFLANVKSYKNKIKISNSVTLLMSIIQKNTAKLYVSWRDITSHGAITWSFVRKNLVLHLHNFFSITSVCLDSLYINRALLDRELLDPVLDTNTASFSFDSVLIY